MMERMEQEKRWISPEVLFSAISEQLAEGRQASFTVTGMSMWPFLCHSRDQVIVEHVKPETIRKGDILLLQTPKPLSRYLLHRVTGTKEGFFETTGDGNFFRDGWFPCDCAIARVTRLVRPDGVISCDRLRWKLLFRLWMALFPFRKYLFRFWARIRVFIRKK